MISSPAIEALAEVVEGTGLVDPRSSGVVLVSGGADSACAAAALVAVCGPESVSGIHVNYGLRLDSDEDERAARALCAKLRIDLHVDRPELGEGNLQAEARDARYAAAERLRGRLGAEWIATGHTRTDIAETMLYRLAVSPGTRPLLGLAPRNGRVIRPLHSVTRAETREIAATASLPFHDDPSNATGRYARNRIRSEVLPVLAEVGSEVERNLAATHAELHEEAELLSGLVGDALDAVGVAPEAVEVDAASVLSMGSGMRRLALRELAERAAMRAVPLNRSRAAAICRLAAKPEGGVVELGGGLEARCESGRIRFGMTGASGAAAPGTSARPDAGDDLAPVRMDVPGRARFGDWELIVEICRDLDAVPGPDVATLDAAALGSQLEVRAWRSGDRIRPLGLGGSKSLQDLFTDRGVPRSERGRVPVVTAGGRVAWVAGVAVSEEFRLGERSSGVAVIRARPAA
ncbi:MAG: tRNA lysidine(34) synthetase TilS [Solirubrobacterales bacterium]|nr:tRNA lysidine(34) synthetase TilS [Solirubrobacterales bacterium]MCB8970723.1 tRNA lysidine(34) synthetase TilS [Thermoleophilales bacterium]MCO5328363.1 tRNA lysidine(34) synthetase TilS [Solirubrobacterales bacterium]